MNSTDIHTVMIEKGFWDWPIDDLQARTWRQLCHVADELYEAYEAAMNDQDPIEELADVCIVILDLLGAHGITFDPHVLHPINPYGCIQQVMRHYRKNLELADSTLYCIMSQCACNAGSVERLCEAIELKMEINKRRPHRYGLATQSADGKCKATWIG